MGSKDDAQARADRRQAERDKRIATGKAAAKVTPTRFGKSGKK